MKMHDAKTYLRASVLLAVAICCGSTLAHMGAAASTAPTTIWSFTGGNGDGANPYPYGHVVFDSNGALYGTTASGGSSSNGTVFQLVPPSVAGAPGLNRCFTALQETPTDGNQHQCGVRPKWCAVWCNRRRRSALWHL